MSRDLFDQKEEIIEEFTDAAYEKLLMSGKIIMLDMPMEEHPSFDFIQEFAQELYEDSLDK